MKIILILDLKDIIQTLLESKEYKNLTDFLKSNILYDIIIANINLPNGNFLDELTKYPLDTK